MNSIREKFEYLELLNLCAKNRSVEQEDALVNIKIQSSSWAFNLGRNHFSLPMQVIAAREKEMKKLLYQHLEDPSRKWTESYMMRTIKECIFSSKAHSPKLHNSRVWADGRYPFEHELFIVLDLDKLGFPCDTIAWRQCLADDIRKFYSTGLVSVCEEDLARGYDVLHAFDCLDILYDKGTVSFDSFATSLRSNARRRYYKHRELIARWIEMELARVPFTEERSAAFVTGLLKMKHTGFEVYTESGVLCDVLSMETSTGDGNCNMVHSFFNEDHFDGVNDQYMLQLRKNFSSFVEDYLPSTSTANFSIRQLHFISHDPSKSFSSFLPVLTITRKREVTSSRLSNAVNRFLCGNSAFPFAAFQECNRCNPVPELMRTPSSSDSSSGDLHSSTVRTCEHVIS